MWRGAISAALPAKSARARLRLPARLQYHYPGAGGAEQIAGMAAAGDAQALDAAWLSRLHRSRSGRVLQDHLACVEDRIDSHGREASIQEAINNRRCFLRAVNSSLKRGRGLPCGLPSPLPKFVAIVNLSGQRMLLTSNRDTMMRKLCARAWSVPADSLSDMLDTFSAFLEHAGMTAVRASGAETNAKSQQFVLITYSLPWQAGLGSAFGRSTPCL